MREHLSYRVMRWLNCGYKLHQLLLHPDDKKEHFRLMDLGEGYHDAVTALDVPVNFLGDNPKFNRLGRRI